MANDKAFLEVGQRGLLDDPAFWPLMPGEQLEWVGRPAARDETERATLKANLLKSFRIVVVLYAIVMALAIALWFFEAWRLSGDVQSLPLFVLPPSRVAVLFSAGLLLIVTLEWLTRQRDLSFTRYAVTDRRVIAARPSDELLLRSRGRHAFQCYSRHVCRAGTAEGGWRTILLNGEMLPGAELAMERLTDAAPLDRLFAASGAPA